MRIYRKQTVITATKDRLRWLFDEFPNVVCNVSGGKDSTVIFHLCLEIAREKGRLPLKVMFIDQEAEWAATIDIIRDMMYHPDVEPWWFQMPIVLFNATSNVDHWLDCWNPDKADRWIHPQDPISIKENHYGTDRFHDIFGAIVTKEWGHVPTAQINGTRVEESPVRYMGLTYWPTYKWVTWGRKENARIHHYGFSAIYDWSYSDVWKAIHEHGWPYNHIYDVMYRYGQPVNTMRVSNLHHETAVHHLFWLQEQEPETYARLTQRISGVDTAGKLGSADYFIEDLPFMFDSWREYRDYLLDNLIPDPDWHARFRKEFDLQDRMFGEDLGDAKYRAHIDSILTYDWELIKLTNFRLNVKNYDAWRKRRGDAEWQKYANSPS